MNVPLQARIPRPLRAHAGMMRLSPEGGKGGWKALDEKGFAGNTMVVFTSHNGAHWPGKQTARYHHKANNGLRGQKADIRDGGHRIPFLCRWSGRIPAGSETDQTLCLTDLLARSTT